MSQLKDNCCSVCGNASLTLAVDRTEYTPVKFENGTWTTDEPSAATYIADHESDTLEDAPIRLLCPECGTHHDVPETLKPLE